MMINSIYYAYLTIILMFISFDFFLIFKGYINKRTIRLERGIKEFPNVNVYVPCKDANKTLVDNLTSILKQDYPKFKVFFIVGNKDDRAYGVIQKLIRGNDKGNLLVAGKARTCCQKNQNLLCGIKKNNNADIFIFFDSDHYYGKDTIKRLVISTTENPNNISTTYFKIKSKDNMFSQLFMNSFASYQYVLESALKFIWGGCMAISKDLFFKLGINEIWKKTAVDDTSIINHIKKKKIGVNFLKLNIIQISKKTTLSKAFKWAVRQIMYVKYYTRFLWIVLIINYFIKCLIIIFPVFAFLFMKELIFYYLSALVFFILALVFSMMIYNKISGTGFPFRMPFYSPIILCVGLVALIVSIFKNKMEWSGYTYLLEKNGKVKSIKFK